MGQVRSPGAIAARVWAAPVPLLALAVLLVNDRWAKAAHPGWVTGKLSDVAWLVVAPLVLAVVLTPLVRSPTGRRRLGGWCATAAGGTFALIQVAPRAAELASTLVSVVAGPSRTVADPTDLLALPALAVPVVVWSRAQRPRPRRGGARWRQPLAATAVPLAALGTVATTCQDPPAVGRVVAHEGAVYADLDFWGKARSHDAGRTWQEAPAGDLPAGPSRRTEACVPRDPQRCYRLLAGDVQVQVTEDGGRTWAPGWHIPQGRERLLRRAHSQGGLCAVGGDRLAPMDIAFVERVGAPATAVIALGEQGVLVHDAAEDSWRRVGVLDAEPHPYSGGLGLVSDELGVLLMLGVLAMGGLLRVETAPRQGPPGGERADRLLRGLGTAGWVVVMFVGGYAATVALASGDTGPGIGVVAVLLAITGGKLLLALRRASPEQRRSRLVLRHLVTVAWVLVAIAGGFVVPLLWIFGGFLGAAVLVAPILLGMVATWSRRRGSATRTDWRRAATGAGAAATTAAVPFVAWSAGLVPWYPLALLLSAVGAALVLSAVPRLADRGRPDHPLP